MLSKESHYTEPAPYTEPASGMIKAEKIGKKLDKGDAFHYWIVISTESNGNGCALNCEASEKSDIILAFIRIIKEVMKLNSVGRKRRISWF